MHRKALHVLHGYVRKVIDNITRWYECPSKRNSRRFCSSDFLASCDERVGSNDRTGFLRLTGQLPVSARPARHPVLPLAQKAGQTGAEVQGPRSIRHGIWDWNE